MNELHLAMNELHLALIRLKTMLDEVAKPIADKGTAGEHLKRFNFIKDLIENVTSELIALQQEDFEDSLQHDQDPRERI